MDAVGRLQLIRELSAFEGRGAGTDAERRAANFLAKRLERSGRRAWVEPTFVHPQYALVLAAHVGLAIAGSLIGISQPAVGFMLVLFAATSFYLDLNTRFYLIRRLFFRRGSQNVVSPGSSPGAPLRLILVAHYDAARTGFAFSRLYPLSKGLSERGRVLLSPLRVGFWGGMAPLLPILGARMASFEPGWLSIVQLFPTVLLILAAFLLVDIALSEIVPGAYDNASGVAAVISTAEQLEAEPPRNLDVWVVLPGAEECLCEGMRGFVQAHRSDLDPERTAIVNVDSVSFGQPSFQVSQGAVASIPMDGDLIGLCRSLADADRAGENRFAAAPTRYGQVDDALPARIRGLPAITILGLENGAFPPWYHTPDDTPVHVDSAALDRSTEFVLSLVRLLDRDVGRRRAVG
ncbi:MAG: M28 family metallopeptidase [Solirubrobacterales bacterium]